MRPLGMGPYRGESLGSSDAATRRSTPGCLDTAVTHNVTFSQRVIVLRTLGARRAQPPSVAAGTASETSAGGRVMSSSSDSHRNLNVALTGRWSDTVPVLPGTSTERGCALALAS